MLKITKIQWLKLWGISAFAALLRILLQLFIPEGRQMPFEPSIINKAGLVPPAFTIYAVIAYGFLGIVFMLIQSGMHGKGLMKGLKFGLLFAVMWSVYLVEPFPHTNGAALAEYISYPLADGTGIIFLGLLLGKFLAQDNAKREGESIKDSGIQIISITVCFIVFRLFEYGVLKYYSSFYERQLTTLIWTAAAGLWVGFMYFYLSTAVNIKDRLYKVMFYSFIVFGIDLCFFNFFPALIFKVNVAQTLIKSLMDIGAVAIGALISDSLFKQNRRRISYKKRR